MLAYFYLKSILRSYFRKSREWMFERKKNFKHRLRKKSPQLYKLILYLYSISYSELNSSDLNITNKIFSIRSGKLVDIRPEPVVPVGFLSKLGSTLDGYKELPRAAFSYAFMSENLNTPRLSSELDLVVMLVISALRVDPRVEREARALANNGYRVCVIAPDISHPPLREEPLDWGNGITFDILDVSAANFSTSPPYLAGDRFLAAALQYKPLAFHCHDLNTCIIGIAAAKYVGCKVVCDFHEWFSENATWSIERDSWVPHDDFKKNIFKAAESLVMRQADCVVTVCDSIAKELNLSYPRWKRDVSVIRNIPDVNLTPTRKYPSIKKQIGVDENSFVVLYQGGVGKTRWLEPIIEALNYSPKTILVIRGPAIELFEVDYKKLAIQFGVEDRLHLLPPVPSRDVVAAANGADAGIYTVANICKNFYYALPNKLFEYIGAELPLLSANYPEPTFMIKNNQLGLLFDPSSPTSIAQAFEGMQNTQVREQFKKNVIEFKLNLSTNNEMNKLVDIYGEMKRHHRLIKDL